MVAAVVALVVVLAAHGRWSATAAAAEGSASPQCVVTAKLVNPCRPWLGAASNGYPATSTDPLSQALSHEQRIGRTLDVVHTYHAAGSNSLSAGEIALATRADTTLFTNWKPGATWTNLGSDDPAIDQMAASVKSLGEHKIFMTLWHEPENDVSAKGDPNCSGVAFVGSAGTVGDYRAMWRYVENRFAADGVSNVVWAMDYVNSPKWDCAVPDLYPGDDLVDWIAFNGYQPKGSNPSFAATVGRFVNLLAADTDATHSFTSKPYAVVEWGSCGRDPGAEIAYYRSATSSLDAGTFPNIDMYMIYDSNGGTVGPGIDLRTGYDDTHLLDPAKAAAYASFADDDSFTGAFSLAGSATNAATAAITSPSAGQALDGAFTVSATTGDDSGSVGSATLLSDGAAVATATPDPSGLVTFAVDAGQLGGGSHTLVVAVTDTSGTDGLSAPVAVTVPAPADLRVTGTTASTVGLAWAPAAAPSVNAATGLLTSPVTGYQVSRDGTPIANLPANSSGFVDAGLAPQTGYTYAVQATGAAGTAIVPVATAAATTGTPSTDLAAPSVPTDVTATALDGSSVAVGWSASTDDQGVAGYEVYRGTTLIASLPATTLGYTDTGLAEATGYGYTVDAFDGASNHSGASAAATATTLDVTAPSRPAQFAAVLSGLTVKLKWSASTDNVGVAGYRVFRDGSLLRTVTTASYTDPSPPQGRSPQYTVTAVDAAGNASVASATVAVAVPDRTAPSVPSGLTARPGTGTVALTWTASTDNVAVTAYRVYRDATLIATVGTPGYTDTGLISRSTHRYALAAVDGAGNVSRTGTVVTVKVQ